MAEKLSEYEIEELIEKNLHNLKKAKAEITDFVFPLFNNFESVIEADYLSHLSEQEKSQMIFKTKKISADSNYEGDLLEDKRHGLGRMFYDSGRYYFGE